MLLGASVVAYVTGAVIAIRPFLKQRAPGEQFDTTPFVVGIGVMLGRTVLQIVSGVFGRSSSDDAATAFETYDMGLRQKLDFCSQPDAPGCP